MTQKLKLSVRPRLSAPTSILFFILGQFCLAVLIAGILFGFGLSKSAYSLLLGSLTFIFPTGCFAIKFFAVAGAQAAGRIVRNFYKAEVIKLMLTVTLFVVILKFIPVDPAVYFISYIGAQMTFWIASFLLPTHTKAMI